MKHPLRFLPVIIALLIGLPAFSAEVKPSTNGPSADTVKTVRELYDGGTFRIAGFGSYRLQDFSHTRDRLGAGAAVQYMVVNNVGVEVSALSEGIDSDSFVDSINDAAVNLKAYLPIGNSGFAPYALVGYTRELVTEGPSGGRFDSGGDNSHNGHNDCEPETPSKRGKTSGRDKDRFNLGAGVEFRAKYAFVFGDFQWTQPFDGDELSHFLARLGAGVHF